MEVEPTEATALLAKTAKTASPPNKSGKSMKSKSERSDKDKEAEASEKSKEDASVKDSKENEKNETSEKSKKDDDTSKKAEQSAKDGKSEKTGVSSRKEKGEESNASKKDNSQSQASTKAANSKKDKKKEEPKPAKKPTKTEKFEELAKGPLGWLLSLLYILALWSVGGALMCGVMFLLLGRVSERPLYFGRGSFIGGSPKVVFEPNPSRFNLKSRSVIEFDADEPSSYMNYLVRYKKLIKDEYNQTGTRCDKITVSTNGSYTEETCSYEHDDELELEDDTGYGPCKLNYYNLENTAMGFDKGEPCIMLRLTRILGWYPSHFSMFVDNSTASSMNNVTDQPISLLESIQKNSTIDYDDDDTNTTTEASVTTSTPFSHDDSNGTKSAFVRNCSVFKDPKQKKCCEQRISFNCTVPGGVEYQQYPKDGMDTCQLPYWNQTGYQSPFVMMRFKINESGTYKIECHVEVTEGMKTLDDDKPNVVKFTLKMAPKDPK